jgi:hypothetical protein
VGPQEPHALAATSHFFSLVNATRMYATGGTCANERWPAPNALGPTLHSENQETCTSYNLLKLARHLYLWTGAGLVVIVVFVVFVVVVVVVVVVIVVIVIFNVAKKTCTSYNLLKLCNSTCGQVLLLSMLLLLLSVLLLLLPRRPAPATTCSSSPGTFTCGQVLVLSLVL